MDPAVQGAIIAAASALSGGGLATGASIYVENRRQRAHSEHERESRLHNQRESRYDERKSAYEQFYLAVSAAEQETLDLEAEHGLLPGDMGYDPQYQQVDKALARLQFIASDPCLETAEACSREFYGWGWGSGSHGGLYEAMSRFVAAVRADLDVNASGYQRPLPTARRPRKPAPEAPGK
jgi:hypothetical protein